MLVLLLYGLLARKAGPHLYRTNGTAMIGIDIKPKMLSAQLPPKAVKTMSESVSDVYHIF
jgi:hypothetical protein